MIPLFLDGLSLASTSSLLGSSAFGGLAGCWLGRWGQLGHMSSITQQDNLDLFTQRLNGVPREGNVLSSLESQKFHKIISAAFYILKQVTRSKIQGAVKQIPPFGEICSSRIAKEHSRREENHCVSFCEWTTTAFPQLALRS